MISIIVGTTENRVIGHLNKIPWYLPRDLKHFSTTTKGHTVIMGRNTYESIIARNGKPLPERNNIVVTWQKDFQAPGCVVVHSLQEALSKSPKNAEVFVIGGSQLYNEALTKADRLYITIIHTTLEGDAFFPEFNKTDWKIVSENRFEKDGKNQFASTYYIYDRRS